VSETPDIEKVAELVKDARIAMLTTVDADGKLVSRPMGLQEVAFDGDLWFFADEASHEVAEIKAHPAVNVSFSNPSHNEWTSVAGNGEIVKDRAKAEELWNPLLNAWFVDGLDTPGLVLIKVHADTAEYWDGPGSKVLTLIGMIRQAITRSTDDKLLDSEHETVQL
jgi:general stress protein 26